MRPLPLVFAVALFFINSLYHGPVHGALVDFSSSGFGAQLDELDVPVPAGPFEVFAGLNLTFVGLSVDGIPNDGVSDLNATGTSLGINATGADSGTSGTARFNGDRSETATFQFDQDVEITFLDFVGFSDAADSFDFAGRVITNGDLDNGTSDFIDISSNPILISANTDFSLSAGATSVIGLQAANINVVAVPEPSLTAMLALTAGSLAWRKRKRKSVKA